MERKKINLEEEFNRLVKKFGLDYRVIIINDKNVKDRGWVNTNNKVIYINSDDYQEAYRILLHEILEIKLNPLLNKYVRLVNVLIEYIQGELYREKERFLEDVLDILIDFKHILLD